MLEPVHLWPRRWQDDPPCLRATHRQETTDTACDFTGHFDQQGPPGRQRSFAQRIEAPTIVVIALSLGAFRCIDGQRRIGDGQATPKTTPNGSQKRASACVYTHSEGATMPSGGSSTILYEKRQKARSSHRRRRDSNPRDGFPPNGFQDRRLQPLGHSSKRDCSELRASLQTLPARSQEGDYRASFLFVYGMKLSTSPSDARRKRGSACRPTRRQPWGVSRIPSVIAVAGKKWTKGNSLIHARGCAGKSSSRASPGVQWKFALHPGKSSERLQAGLPHRQGSRRV